MVVSDAGLASTEPQWWNASPLGCVLLGLQPRGGWQVMQRAVQWGGDSWARCFGVSCKVPVVYAYFACGIRNRLEVWKSERFFSPMEAHVPLGQQLETNKETNKHTGARSEDKSSHTSHGLNMAESKKAEEVLAVEMVRTVSPDRTLTIEPVKTAADSERARRESGQGNNSGSKKDKSADNSWIQIDRGVAGAFTVRRPTKLIDGSRGGQAFMCSLFLPESGKAYGVEEQARLQLLSVILVAAGLGKDQTYNGTLDMMREDFEVSHRLGLVFRWLLCGVLFVNVLVLGFVLAVFYALWDLNLFGLSAPYVIQLCSFFSWASGAVGLMMMGGNPRVRVDQSKPAPKHIQERLDSLPEEYARLEFGSLHGSIFVKDRGACGMPSDLVRSISRWRLEVQRTSGWLLGMAWFSSFLAISITLQIAGAKVSTTRSEILGIVILIATSVLRGAGISGPESWMIPKWRRRKNAKYSTPLLGQIRSRASISETSG